MEMLSEPHTDDESGRTGRGHAPTAVPPLEMAQDKSDIRVDIIADIAPTTPPADAFSPPTGLAATSSTSIAGAAPGPKRSLQRLWAARRHASLRAAACESRLAQRALITPRHLTPLTAFIGSFIGLGGLAMGELAAQHVSSDIPLDPQLLLLGSFGALSTLVFASNSPLCAPRNTLFGHLTSLCVAYSVHYASAGAAHLAGTPPLPATLEKVLSPAMAIALMLRLNVRLNAAGTEMRKTRA